MLSDFKKEKVFWTRKMNLNLVKFIQSKPYIWHPKHPKYTSCEAKDHTYSEFAAKYGNAFSGQAVKERWTNIRSTFAYYLRKVKAGAAQNELYKVNWHLWEPCQFLLKVSKGSYHHTSLENEEICIKNSSDVEDSIIDTKSEDNHSLGSNTDKRLSCRNVAENLLSIFKGVQNDGFGLNNSKNSKIGKAVTEKLSQLESLEATKYSMKIIDILWLYDQNNQLNPNNIKPEEIF